MQDIFEKGMTLIELTVVLLILVALAGLAIPYVGSTNRMALCQATDASMQAVKTAIMGGGANSGFYMDLLGEYPRDRFDANGYNLAYLFVRDNGLDDDGDGVGTDFDGVFDPDEEWREFNPKTAVGWRGPYLMSGGRVPAGLNNSFADIYDPADAFTNTFTMHVDITADVGSHVMDAWGRPIILQVPYDTDAAEYSIDNARLVSAGPGNGIGSGNAVINTRIRDNPDANDRGDDRVLYLRVPDPLVGGNESCNDG